MPFESKAQVRYLFANHPDVAKKFAAATPPSSYPNLPEHVKKHPKKKKRKGKR